MVCLAQTAITLMNNKIKVCILYNQNHIWIDYDSEKGLKYLSPLFA